jgi:multicomponent K+:H+ antiporter subunit G
MQALPVWLDLLLTALLVIGVVFALIGSWGLAKLGDFAKRLHGPTKATTLGVGCVLIASGLWFTFGKGLISLHELLITLFLFMTAPVSAHLLIKAAMRMGAAPEPPPLPQPGLRAEPAQAAATPAAGPAASTTAGAAGSPPPAP